MTDASTPDEAVSWSLSEHLERGYVAIEQIAEDDRNKISQPVCHHFWAFTNSEYDFDEIISGRRFAVLTQDFESLSLIFDAGGLEAWETIIPTKEWLAARIPSLFQLAMAKGLSGYHGWTWEPRVGQPIGACEFQVINKKTQATN